MERKYKIEIAFAVLVIIALIVLVMWLLREPIRDVIVVDTSVENIDDQVILNGVIEVEIKQSDDADTIARIFVERLGSFSNESNYENLEIIKQLSTQSMQNRLDKMIENAIKNGDEGSYYGVSTTFVSATIINVSDTTESFRIKTQRRESISSPANTQVRFQDIVVSLVKIGDNWLIDDFNWE